ncbi:phage minor tail protein L [Zophobihabitans entericus]|uniref:Phage minor tail protein L n=1 Tax=Zophobihabitans entericus TaxID=1635327 RepID=A0A6G9IBD7_9GAMM|nr:phage minor tail protein L [Zophobihabitans entericus]QIQ21024.1 phage minor tail protein L [Zophobihabitans entericus]
MIPEKTYLNLSDIEQDSLLDLFEVDLSEIAGEKTIFRFHSGVNQKYLPVLWQGNVYEPYPIVAQGFEKNGQGTSNRPTLSVANIAGLITGLSEDYEDLLGALVTRRQVLAKFLDSENFQDGNVNSDPTQEIISRYVIERMSSLNAEAATFELALPCESDGALIPARVIIAHTCCWRYRSSECGYTGQAVADEYDNPTSDYLKDKCSRSLTGCKCRFGEHNPLPFGGFPSSAKLS